jgi:hypothetical protein
MQIDEMTDIGSNQKSAVGLLIEVKPRLKKAKIKSTNQRMERLGRMSIGRLEISSDDDKQI